MKSTCIFCVHYFVGRCLYVVKGPWPKVRLANTAGQQPCPGRERQVTGQHRTQGLIPYKNWRESTQL
jgi:hypothetical protein